MNYLLDTCVISELIKPQSNQKVVDWIEHIDENHLFVSVLTIGEIHKGISKLPESKKKEKLQKWIHDDLKKRFTNRTIEITEEICVKWGKIQGEAEIAGNKMPVIDGLIAATAIKHGLVLVTRNVKDIEQSGCKILNLWE